MLYPIISYLDKSTYSFAVRQKWFSRASNVKWPFPQKKTVLESFDSEATKLKKAEFLGETEKNILKENLKVFN